jgi:hypothetical protein
MDLQIETATNEVKDQPSRMEDIQTVPKAAVKQSGYVPPFFIVAPPVFVFGAIVIGLRRTYSEAFPDEKQPYVPSKNAKREVLSQGEEIDNANPSFASSSAGSATSVPNTGAPANVQQDASVTEKVILGKHRNYEEAFSTEEEHPSEHEDRDSSKKYKFDHDFSPELAFELQAMMRGFAKLSIDYPAGACCEEGNQISSRWAT